MTVFSLLHQLKCISEEIDREVWEMTTMAGYLALVTARIKPKNSFML